MSESATVPILDPAGQVWDIPYEKMHDALKSGGKIGVYIKDPQGKQWVIPAERTQDAVKAGGTVVPYNLDQSHQKPGFWPSLGSDLKGMVQGLVPDNPLTETHDKLVSELHQEQASDAAAQNSPERQAHGALYRNVGVPAATALGVNVPGMEQSAAQGDPAGVVGHAAAVPAAMALTAGVAKGAGAAIDALPSAKLARAGEAFQDVSATVGKHTVPVTNELSGALAKYQQLVDAGGSRSLVVSKLLTRLTDPAKGPLTYDEARLFQSNISRLSADEAQRLTPVMKRQVGQIAGSLNDAVESTAAAGGKLEAFQGAMKDYAAAKDMQAKQEILQKYLVRAGLAAAGGGLAATGAKMVYEMGQR